MARPREIPPTLRALAVLRARGGNATNGEVAAESGVSGDTVTRARLLWDYAPERVGRLVASGGPEAMARALTVAMERKASRPLPPRRPQTGGPRLFARLDQAERLAGEGVRQSDMARRLRVSPSTVSRDVRALRRWGRIAQPTGGVR